VDEKSLKAFMLFICFFCSAGFASEALSGRAALAAIYGRKVVFHPSIGNRVTWVFLPNGTVIIQTNGNNFNGHVREADNGAICIIYHSLNNLEVCHNFVLRENKLTKVDLASQVGSEGEVARVELIQP
jgi:hypothetical protein